MAQRDRISSRGRVQDRRGQKVVRQIGGISLTGVLLLLAVGYFSGPETAVELFDTMQEQSQLETQVSAGPSEFDGKDEYEVFVSTVLGSTNGLRQQSFKNSGLQYRDPTIVLFRGATQSACGGAVSQVGPHYCPLDETIYLDETFFEELTRRFGAQGGDMAQAYVIAHEVGHHVQHLLGITDRVQQARRVSTAAGNDASIRLELQADCLAGIWANSVRSIMDRNDLYEAMDAASSVGDDAIQEKTTGHVHPESWTHGSSDQRKEWFTRGYELGDFQQCNTFGS